MSKAVFLDRDGTIIDDPGYLSDPNAVILLSGAARAIGSLARAGYKIVVVTNQSGVARGLLSEETLGAIHAEMCRMVSAEGGCIDAVYYCPYHEQGTVARYAAASQLRKPKPGMLLKAADEMNIDLESSWMVGDSDDDIAAGQGAGCRTIRLLGCDASAPQAEPPEAASEKASEKARADFTVADLVAAAEIILGEPARPRTT